MTSSPLQEGWKYQAVSGWKGSSHIFKSPVHTHAPLKNVHARDCHQTTRSDRAPITHYQCKLTTCQEHLWYTPASYRRHAPSSATTSSAG